jgi:uncharacterized protein YegJ (DUF2314 family)
VGILKRIKGALGKRGDAGPKHSLVFLRTRPFDMNERSLREAAERAFGVHLAADDPQAKNFAVVNAPTSMVKIDEWVLAVHSFLRPYVKDPEKMAETIGEGRLRRAVSLHRAWLAVDLMSAPEGVQDQHAYQMIGRLLAEFADDHCVALYHPSRRSMRVYSEEMADQLRGADPLTATAEVPHPPVTAIEADDPRMKKAVDEARSRFPEFVRAFESGEGSYHSVKAPITVGGSTEFIWIKVTEIGTSTIRGTLGNEPVDLAGLHEGDPVETTLDNLNDWLYMKDDELVGGFTVSVLSEAADRAPQ